MEYAIDYNTAVWFAVPASFPTAEFADEGAWLDAFIGEYERDLGRLQPGPSAALREFAARARAERKPLATEFLLFCPRSIPVLGMVAIHIVPSDPASALDLDAALADDRALLPPTFDDVQAVHLGAGRRACAVVPSSSEPSAGGRIGYAFERSGAVVIISATADHLPDASLLMTFVERLIDGIRLEEAA
ncbi:hypothetical protein [Agromyces aureus]|uniref:Uncharacterized protein n=1 Tax=Agromyces aureus TaxID=453304 RepID=A0A191WI89_9MICO|nr:hypothetical protein [Agromyces aureus]ANJ27894.1 hypothetical protein ATC03_15395 [Agromyces aureus]